MKARIGCARARAGAWFDALSRGARGDQGGSRGARVARGNEPEPEAPQSRYRRLAELGQGGTANVYLAVASGPNGFNKLVVHKRKKK